MCMYRSVHFSRRVLARWVRIVCAGSISYTHEVGIRNPSNVRARSVAGEVPVCAGVRFVQNCLTGAHVT